MLKGHNTTQCFFGNWTGMTPWCKEGWFSGKYIAMTLQGTLFEGKAQFQFYAPFPGFIENS
jgi:hypothetical protein